MARREWIDSRDHRNVLLIATTNFAKALDAAVLSRTDHVEEIGLPTESARREIILDTLKTIGGVWNNVHDLGADVNRLAKISEGLDGRRIGRAQGSGLNA
jgi:SpoVK/Ycf46/Vps4 family AAA+-type ATPase